MAARSVALASVLIMSSWIPAASAVGLEKLVMPGEVIAGHADIEAECGGCHVAFSRDKQRDQCLSCHEDVADDLRERVGYHGRDAVALVDNCAACHTDHQGREADIVGLDPELFDHALTDFVLTGVHVDTDCVDCHAVDEIYRAAPVLCYDCHVEDDPHDGGLGQECADCHVTTDWADSSFDHFAESGYALTGGHELALCIDCHENDIYSDTPTECYGCHRVDDSHEGLNGIDCAACHDNGQWDVAFFDHADSGFELTGTHAEISCADCHVDPVFEVSLDDDCYSCHRDDDDHDGLNGQECGSCHTAKTWTTVNFDHALDANFELIGAHATLACADCHVVPVLEANPAVDCFGCHGDDDPHEAQLGNACDQCHGEVSWTEKVAFDHGLTDFPLIGSHGDVECDGCHESSRFNDAPGQCIDCHRADDTHRMALGPDCGDCHSPVDWPLWNFDHNLQTSFVIDGAHTPLTCTACHTLPSASGIELETTCAGCHRSDDVHRGDFGNDCERCHTTRDFRSVERIN